MSLTNEQRSRIDAAEANTPFEYRGDHVTIHFNHSNGIASVFGNHIIASFDNPEQAILRLEEESLIWNTTPEKDRMKRYIPGIELQLTEDLKRREQLRLSSTD